MTTTDKLVSGQRGVVLGSAIGGLCIDIIPGFIIACSNMGSSLMIHIEVQRIGI